MTTESDALSKRVLKSVNPFNGETLKTYAEMSPEAVDEAINRAHAACATWRNTSFAERSALLTRAAALCRERHADLARMMTLEMGKLIGDADFEVILCGRIFEYYASHGADLLKPMPIPSDHGDATVASVPVGPVFGIQPWNYPLYQPIRFAAPNLMAGNVVLTKHASNVPQCAEALEQLLTDAGFPGGVYTNLAISARLAGRVIDDDRVQGVSFTGSNAAGAKVAERAGQNVKKTIMELGGSDPLIVLDDADVTLTVEKALVAKMHNHGQSCIAAKRFVVLESVADEFVQRFKDTLGALQPGDPLDASTGYGPVCSEQAAEDLEDQIQRSVAAGAEVILGGKRDHAFIEPTILTNVRKGNPAYEEELFGPVASVIVVPDDATAIEVANDNMYGLGASIYSQNIDRARRVAERIEAGMVFINQPVVSYADTPFGGIKKSGYGRELGPLGIQEMVNKKLTLAAK